MITEKIFCPIESAFCVAAAPNKIKQHSGGPEVRRGFALLPAAVIESIFDPPLLAAPTSYEFDHERKREQFRAGRRARVGRRG
ncbi:MAG TPA: hypothetical protein VIP46_06895, partial [Pyrinomonadaceae bacterium]